MQAKYLILGACTAGLVAGSAGGLSISTQPRQSPYEPLADIPRHEFALDSSPREMAGRADHYELVTPEGVVPVSDLAIRGRMQGQRPFDPGLHDPQPSTVMMQSETSPAQAVVVSGGEPGWVWEAPTGEGPVEQSESTLVAGSARLIDVSAELAAREQARSLAGS